MPIASIVSLMFALTCEYSQPPSDIESQIEQRRSEIYDALAASVKLHEELLNRELKLQKSGASSEMEVNARRQVLAILRHDLAVSNEDNDEGREQMRALVKLREANAERLMKLQAARAVPVSWVLSARRQVANAKYILAVEEEATGDAINQLKNIVEICTVELNQAEEAAKSGSTSPAEVGFIRGRMAYAKYLLEHEKDDPSKAIGHLRVVVTERENTASRIEKLYRSGAVGRIVFAEAQHNAMWSKANLAIVEEKRTEVRDILKKLVEFAKEDLAYWKTHPDLATPDIIARCKAAVADYELRFALASDPRMPFETMLRKSIYLLDY